MQRYLIVTLFLIGAAQANADNWPSWRGPTGVGFCEEKNVPKKWSGSENVKWKITLENAGNSTPVIWGDKIFLTQANKNGSIRSLLCLDRANGNKLWQKDVSFEGYEQNWGGISFTNSSASTDGEMVVVSFASAGMFAYDFQGNELWKRTDLGTWQHSFGNGSSPVLYKNLAILWCGPNQHNKIFQKASDLKGAGGAKNTLLAVDKKTGKTVWEKSEPQGSWATPTITKVDGKDQLLLGMGPTLKGYDPNSGEILWFCKGMEDYVYSSALFSNGIAVGMSGYNKAAIAVKLGKSGDITEDRLWLHKNNIQRVGSGMFIGDHVYIVEENGMPHCYEAKTGKEVWNVKDRPGSGTTWGSMIHAEGRLYVLMRNGETLVLAANPKYELLGINPLGKGEQTNSSIAVSNGEIYIRTFRNLYCIAEKK